MSRSPRRKKQNKRHPWRWFGWLIPLAAAAVLYFVLPSFPDFTESVFSNGIHHALTSTLGWVVGQLPFSLTELFVLSVPFWLVVLIIVAIVGSVQKHRGQSAEKPSFRIGWVLTVVAWGVSSVLLAYMLLHGVNYYRLTAAELCELPTDQPYSDEQVLTLCEYFADKASEEREALTEDEDGCMQLSQSLYITLHQVGDGYDVLDDRYSFLQHSVGYVKPVLISHLWSYTGIAGVYCPVLMEANVNIDQPDFCIPSSAAHESAHLRGFAREDECNFFACLSCFDHPSADYRYSGYMLAFVYTYNELYARDKTLCAEADAHCSAAVQRDLTEQSRYWKSFEGAVQDLSVSLNDTFIEAQGVEDGGNSYNRVVDLLLAYFNQ